MANAVKGNPPTRWRDDLMMMMIKNKLNIPVYFKRLNYYLRSLF